MHDADINLDYKYLDEKIIDRSYVFDNLQKRISEEVFISSHYKL
jgi:hypothetical protein